MKHIKRSISFLLSLLILVTMLPTSLFAVNAAASVKIVSFMRGEVDDLRSSELLMAQVEGYDGDTSQLTYVWTNNLYYKSGSGKKSTTYYTYLYVFNSHNMYTVQDTNSEIEIYQNSRGQPSSNGDRSSPDTFSGVGYAYAAVYGADYSEKKTTYASSKGYAGSITVAVYDGDTLIGTATYTGFKEPDLDADLDNAVFGLFEGDTINVKDLLGESAIVHINCSASSVTSASMIGGSDCISIGGSSPNYTVTGLSKGVAQIEITVTKDYCKFHSYTSGTASPLVYVFRKPSVTPGLTTLTLTDLDPDCTYYIGSQQGKPGADGTTIVFEGLDPSTTYDIEVRGHYTDNDGTEKVVYAYTVGTTLTPGNVTFYVNNIYSLQEVFRVYYSGLITLPEGEQCYQLNDDGTITSFYDLPELSYEDNNKCIFKGWYLDQDNENDTRPISWSTAYPESTESVNIYAHWIYLSTVDQDADDPKELPAVGVYNEYDLVGVQIRNAEKDDVEHYGTAGSGLRFITVFSESAYDQVNAIHSSNASGAKYGFVMAKTATAEKYAAQSADPENYQLQYKDSNVNGVDTTTAFKYVQNVQCSGVTDHMNFEDYRLYTAVVTYKNKEGEALAQAQAQQLLARSYIRYYDANGLYRTYYNNYTGTPSYHGCSASYSEVLSVLKGTD